MLMVTAFSAGDAKQAADLFEWILELDGPISKHSCLLVASKGMHKEIVRRVRDAATKVFIREVSVISPHVANEFGWPVSANHLFRTAYDWVRMNWKAPWWWHEPDCIPVRRGWLDALERQYRRKKRPFLGVVYHRPFPHVTGCAVYPPNIEDYNPEILHDKEKAWDCVSPHKTIPQTFHTRIFQHEWGNIANNIAPTFPNQRSLGLIKRKTMVFHRNKDGTLIERLRERRAQPIRTRITARLEADCGNGFQDFHEHDFSRPKRVVHGVALVAIDGRSDCRATTRAMMRAGDQMQFDQCLLLSPERPEMLPMWIEHQVIPPMDLNGYNRFCLTELFRHIKLPHCLTVQADSGINNPDAWSDEFLNWDYLGAPWPPGWAWDDSPRCCQRTGNSGFCLRSRKWLEMTADLPTANTRWHGQLLPRCVDDVIPCVNFRERMIWREMKIAPVEAAARFAFEQPTPECQKLNSRVFGFHLYRP